MNCRVLLVEDDFDLAETVIQYLELEGIVCDHGASGPAGLELIHQHYYDVLLLDIGLPRMDGLALCHAIRKEGRDTPVLMLTARDTLEDKLAGFDAGTDDYLIKPFAMEELVVRITALARRRSGKSRRLRVGSLFMDLDTGVVTRDGKSLSLTPTGWTLLEILVRESPRVVAKERLITAIWPDGAPESNSLKVHLFKLRQQVDRPFSFPMIETVSGKGVALREETEK